MFTCFSVSIVYKSFSFICLQVPGLNLVTCLSCKQAETEKLVNRRRLSISLCLSSYSLVLLQGFTPYLVNATGGTTVLGAYDPIVEIADICEKYDMWLHVDVCWGGGALLSAKHRALLDGIERFACPLAS